MKNVIVLFIMFTTMLFGKWDKAYSSGEEMIMPNDKINYERKFKKEAEDKDIYDESMKNRLVPFVEVEDRVTKNKKAINKYFYSSNKRHYYSKDLKDYKKFPTIE